MATKKLTPEKAGQKQPGDRKAPPEVYAIVIECNDEPQQRELFERLKREGMKVRVLVL